MRTIETTSRTALARLLRCLLLGSLGVGCNARLDISDETLADAGRGGNGGSGGSGGTNPPPVHADAGSPGGSCDDGVRSGGESDIDCGGDACPVCAAGASCERHTDCESGTCLAGACLAASCEDGIRNGDELGVDCGGDCQRCRSTTCNCASSPALTPLACDETEGYVTPCGEPFLSADGETFVFALCYMERADASTNTGFELFRRRPDGTTEALGDAGALGLSSDGQRLLIQGSAVSVVNAEGARTIVPLELSNPARISADGAIVFGQTATPAGARTLGRWSESGGLDVLSELSRLTSAQEFEIRDVSHDGSVVVGSSYDGTSFTPFRWTETGGLEDLGALPEGVSGARAMAVSVDGSTIAGFTVRGFEADVFLWNAQDQLRIMGPAYPLAAFPQAATLLLSEDDGAVLVGVMQNQGMVHMGPAGTLATTEAVFPTDMTADGSVVVGHIGNTGGFLWRPPAEPLVPSVTYGVTSVETLAAQTGADSTGWAFQSITNISDDARIIYGTGTCGGVPTYYRMQRNP